MENPMIGSVYCVTGLQKAKNIRMAKAKKAVAAHWYRLSDIIIVLKQSLLHEVATTEVLE